MFNQVTLNMHVKFYRGILIMSSHNELLDTIIIITETNQNDLSNAPVNFARHIFE